MRASLTGPARPRGILPAMPAAPESSPPSAPGPRLSRELLLAAALLLASLALQVATLSDYGVSWDFSEMVLGDRNLRFYLTGDGRWLDYARPAPAPLCTAPGDIDLEAVMRGELVQVPVQFPHHVWPVGPLAAALTHALFHERLGWLGPVESRHLAPVLWLHALGAGLFLFCRAHLSARAGLLALLALLAHPRLFAEAHVNFKDVPALALFSLVVLAFFHAVRRGSPRWLLGAAALWGLGLATRANVLLLPLVLVPWYALQLRRGQGAPRTPAWRRAWWAVLPLALGLAAVCWPFLLREFPRHLLDHARFLAEKGAGGAGDKPWLPWVLALTTTPVPLLALAGLGFLALRRRGEGAGLAALLGLWMAVPLLRVTLPGAQDYDGIRHWLEVLLPVLLLAGVGGELLAGRAADGLRRAGLGTAASRALAGALAVAACAPAAAWNVRNHPFQIAYFNGLVGGLGGAQARGLPGASDYWSLSTRSAMRWLDAHAERGALVLPLVAAHTWDYPRAEWLRGDLVLVAQNRQDRAAAAQAVWRHGGPVYLTYATLAEHYDDFTRHVDASLRPVAVFGVDGGVVHKVFRVVKEPGPLQVPAPSAGPGG